MKLSMSVWIAVNDLKEADQICKFIVEKFNKPYNDIIIAAEHPFPTDEDFKKEDPE